MLPVVPLTSHICIYNSTIGSQRIVCFVITRKLCHNRNNFLLNLECPFLQRLKFDLLISHVISLWQISIFLLNQIIILCCYTLWQHETPRISLPFVFSIVFLFLCVVFVFDWLLLMLWLFFSIYMVLNSIWTCFRWHHFKQSPCLKQSQISLPLVTVIFTILSGHLC